MFLFIGAPSLKISYGTTDWVELYSPYIGTKVMDNLGLWQVCGESVSE
jgi:hypothetical protein